MKSVQLDRFDATVRYHVVGGAGKPLVFLAGLNFSCIANWLDVAVHPLLGGRNALMIDYLGTGHSDTLHDVPLSLEDHAASIAAVLDHEGLRDCVIVGYSMGGTVGIHLAQARPDLVSHLVVYEANVIPGGGAGTKYIAQFDQKTFAEKIYPEMLADLKQKAIEGDPEAAALVGGWANSDVAGIHASSVALIGIDQDFYRAYCAMDVRRTFVMGELSQRNDGEPANADAPHPKGLREHGINVVVIPEAGHLIVLTEPDLFAKVLAGCL